MSQLQLPDLPLPSWARILPTGGEGGVEAFQIDGSMLSARNYMMYRLLLPMGSAPSVRASVRFKSSLVAYNASSEGFAARFRGYDANGNKVWDSQPEIRGRRAWRIDQSAEWKDAVFVEPVPGDKGIREITCEFLVRAASGLLTLCKPECRYHYAYTVDCSLSGFSRWIEVGGVFTRQVVIDDIDGEQIVRYVRFARTERVDIPRGKFLTSFVNGAAYATAYEGRDQPNLARELRRLDGSTAGIMLKYRRKGIGQYDFVTLGEIAANSEVGFEYRILNNSVSRKAEHDYDQIEVLPYVQPTNINVGDGWNSLYSSGGTSQLALKDVAIEVVVADYLEPTQ